MEMAYRERWQAEVKEPRLAYPKEQEALERGYVYRWEVTDAEGEAFAAKAGFDPRPLDHYPFFRVRPTKIQAWREVNELKDRVLMDAGIWLV